MDNLKCFCNRELSWLKFNERVLDLAGAEKTPIGERLNFLSIYQSNLDEFFMVRVGTLVDQMQIPDFRENKTHMSAKEQLEEVFKRYKEIEKKKNHIYSNLLHELEAFGIHLVDYTSATAAMKKELVKLFDNSIAPYLSPIITGKPMPFPFMVNKQQYVVTRLSTKGGKPKIGVINCANDEFPRFIAVPGRKSEFVLSEQVILNNVDRVFKQFKVEEKAIIRVTRNADIDADEIYDESMDYRDIMETLIKQRKRLSPVRLEVSEKLSKPFRKELCGYLGMDKDHIVLVSSDMDLTYVSKMKALLPDDKSLYYAKRIPRGSLGLNMKGSIINQVIKKDRLLS
ncbi:MAG: polyphosphate kinase 1, partial [Lachnospiraceae bacterium]|nr:polyphosphate kinase 1 [Lachnospiraceae bacterium]